MIISCAINGFGRIGKNILRAIFADPAARERVAIRVINVGPADPAEIAYSFTYDTLLGKYPGTVVYSAESKTLTIDGHGILVIAEPDPVRLNWKKYDISWVIDASGRYTDARAAQAHIRAGAKKVLITAPAEGEDASIVLGVNDAAYDAKKHAIVSLGSCTTNALVPMLHVLLSSVGIVQAVGHTIHAYTPSQSLHDSMASGGDPRRLRAAALNIVPSGTGASKMVAKILPELAGRVMTQAVRVPVATVSLLELTVVPRAVCSTAQLHTLFQEALQQRPDIFGYSDIPLVSSDFARDSRSLIYDATLTLASEGLCVVAGWYDNEWGYSCRVRDFLMKYG